MTSVPRELHRPRKRRVRFDLPHLESTGGLGAARRIALVSLVFLIFSIPGSVPTIGHSEVRVITPALAILSFAFTWLPRREAPVYALMYAATSLSLTYGSGNLGFEFAATVIKIGEAAGMALLVPRHLSRRQMILKPFRVIGYIAAALAISLLGASLTLAAAALFDFSAAQYARELGGDPMLAWRHWWLGHACSFVTIAGTLTFLRQTNRADWNEIFADRHERRTFVAGTLAHTAIALLALPVWDMSWLGLPADVRLALSFAPIMTAIALSLRFKGVGTAIAVLIATITALYSVTGPYAAQNWAGLPSMVTPVQFALMATAAMSWSLAVTLRRLQWANQQALEASEMKSRFIGMLNHELRTPLNAILGFSELMRLQNQRALGEAVAPVENIHASGQRLLAMIEGLLSQADHGASVFDLEKHPLPVRSHVAAAIAEAEAEPASAGCNIRLDAPDDMVIDADPRALKQMLSVLVGYPLRFIGPETSITVSAAHHGTDTVIEVRSEGLINASGDDRDKLEVQLVNALALAHGARLNVRQMGRTGRIARLTFFATHAAA